MKTLLIAVLAIALVIAIGWISISGDDQEANIKINTQKIRQDTQEVVDKGKDLVENAERAINNRDADSKPSP